MRRLRHAPAGAAAAGGQPGLLARLRARGVDPEFGVSAFLLAIGILILVESTEIAPDVAGRGPVGPRAIPVFIGIGLVVLAVWHAVDVARGGHGEAEAGEDIDAGAPADWRTLGLLAAGFIANILLIETIGWPLSGALLFWVAARALGSRTPVRDIGTALVLGVLSYELFAGLLDIALPAGPLEGVL